jgi:hypothetical protein
LGHLLFARISFLRRVQKLELTNGSEEVFN